MPLRYDTLSDLIDEYNNKLAYIFQLLAELDATVTAIQADGDYAAQTSAGTKTILTDTHTSIVSANTEMLVIPSE